jgi:heptosyltransferase-1
LLLDRLGQAEIIPEKFAEVANILKQNALIIYGTENERLIAQKIAEKSPYVQIIPKLDLNALKMLISKVDLVIGNDTGPTHMASGLNKPSITLFGCTPVNRVYQTDINRVLKSSSVVNPRKLNKQDDSVKTIDVNQIVNLSINLLNDTRS